MNAQEARDAGRARTQAIEDAFVAGALANSEVQEVARREAVALVEKQEKDRFEQAVIAAIEEEKEKARRADQNTEE
ncbi:MAG: hypothetical protein V3S60_01265 [Acidimicrobiia bacterium]